MEAERCKDSKEEERAESQTQRGLAKEAAAQGQPRPSGGTVRKGLG